MIRRSARLFVVLILPPCFASLFAGCSHSSATEMTIALMPKSKGNGYFVACKQGADEEAKESVSSCCGMARPILTRPSRTRSSIPGSPAAWT